MASIALLLAGLLGLLCFVLSAAVIELFRDLRQVRDAMGILDRALPIEIGDHKGAEIAELGLPIFLSECASSVVLFLSDRCSTCRILGQSFHGECPQGMAVVVVPSSNEAGKDFVESYGLVRMAEHGELILDNEGKVAERLALKVTPVAYLFENGKLTSATTVPSVRFLHSIIPSSVSVSHAA